MDLFYDFAVLDFENFNNYYHSAGSQLLLDFSVLRIGIEFNAGIQAAYLINENKFEFGGILLGVTFWSQKANKTSNDQSL